MFTGVATKIVPRFTISGFSGSRWRSLPSMKLPNFRRESACLGLALAGLLLMFPGAAYAGEASLKLPDFGSASFMGGVNGRTLLMGGLLVCLAGLAFGIVIYGQLKRLPVHRSMLEVSELIYAT